MVVGATAARAPFIEQRVIPHIMIANYKEKRHIQFAHHAVNFIPLRHYLGAVLRVALDQVADVDHELGV